MRPRRFWTLAAALPAALAASPAAALEPHLHGEEVLAARLDADLNGDGQLDIAYVTATEDGRALTIALAEGPSESLDLESTPFGGGSFTFHRGVLQFEDLTGGTTAVASIRRFRYERSEDRMRLIGLDASGYSRTYAHDGFELSWNLLNGTLITRELRLNTAGGRAAYHPSGERKSRRRSAPVWLTYAPDPEQLLDELDQH